MDEGLVELSAAGQRVAEVVVGVGEVGVDFQGRSVLGDGLVGCPRLAKAVPEVEVGRQTAGLDFQGLAVLLDGLVESARGRPRRGRGCCGPALSGLTSNAAW